METNYKEVDGYWPDFLHGLIQVNLRNSRWIGNYKKKNLTSSVRMKGLQNFIIRRSKLFNLQGKTLSSASKILFGKNALRGKVTISKPLILRIIFRVSIAKTVNQFPTFFLFNEK